MRTLICMTHNGLGIAAVGDFETRQSSLAPKFHGSTTVQVCSSAPIAAIPCYVPYFTSRQ